MTLQQELLRARALLRDSAPVAEIRAAFSRLRTELKYECGSYSREEADTQIPEAA